MTIAVSIKVHDGVVFASDSATTLVDAQGLADNVYNSANKIFNLYKGRPIGAMTWGAGSIGHPSIATLAKDLRRRFMGRDSAHAPWALPENYTMESVAVACRQYLYEELYVPVFASLPEPKPQFGFLVAGYSGGADLAEEWRFTTDDAGACAAPELIRALDETGMSWHGQPEAPCRLVNGYAPGLPQALLDMGLPPDQLDPAMDAIADRLAVQLAVPAMPIQDAIDLAEFLAYTAIMFSRFAPGANTVGGPIEVAAITKHEGFRWVKRKHWFDAKLNPKEGEAP